LGAAGGGVAAVGGAGAAFQRRLREKHFCGPGCLKVQVSGVCDAWWQKLLAVTVILQMLGVESRPLLILCLR
jgi:hypothetical protein